MRVEHKRNYVLDAMRFLFNNHHPDPSLVSDHG